jgi:hypothetical protein
MSSESRGNYQSGPFDDKDGRIGIIDIKGAELLKLLFKLKRD